MTEVRTTSSTGGEKGTKPERYDLIPIGALATVARLYGKGAEKYAEHNWRRGYEWSKSYAALQRHATQFWSGEDIDEEMQLPHLASVVFHAFTLMTFMEEQREYDDRFIGPMTEKEAHLEALRQKLTDPIKRVAESVITNHVNEEIFVPHRRLKDVPQA